MYKNKILISLLSILILVSLSYVKADIDNKSLKQSENNYEINHILTNLSACFTVYTKNQIKNVDVSLSGKTSEQIASMMGKAWNLGNALDSTMNGTVGETLWGNPVINKSLFELVKVNGFDTVRIPISFMDKISNADNGYTIDKAWLARIKEVVDYALDSGMFVIINIHHDGNTEMVGNWIDVSLSNSDARKEMLNKFSSVWTQLATTFANYDQHLIFESMNEVMITDKYTNTSSIAYENINTLNQTFVDTVRNVDGNLDRCLIIPGYNASIDLTINNMFKKPKDKIDDRLMLSVHYYDPFNFALNKSDNAVKWGTNTEKQYMENSFKRISDFAKKLSMPVIIGEYGAIDKNNIDERYTYLKTLNEYANKYGIVTAYWDNGLMNKYEFALFNRNTNTVIPELQRLINAITN